MEKGHQGGRGYSQRRHEESKQEVVEAGAKCLGSGHSWMRELAGFPEELEVGAERKGGEGVRFAFWETGRSRLGTH